MNEKKTSYHSKAIHVIIVIFNQYLTYLHARYVEQKNLNVLMS